MTPAPSIGPMTLPEGPLENRWLRLEPFGPANRVAVGTALDCDPDTWAVFAGDGRGAAFEGYWREAMAGIAAGSRRAYAVIRRSDGRVVGTTSFLGIDRPNRSAEIGATFYAPEARGGAINPACKHLLLSTLFDAGAHRCQFNVDGRNLRSQAAVAKLGAVREGVLRRHRITWTGHVRDTVVFGVTDQDWPAVRAGLEARLAGFS